MSNNSNYNMVESTKNSQEDLTKVADLLSALTIRKISAADIEFDITYFEKFTEGWDSFEEEKKKFFS